MLCLMYFFFFSVTLLHTLTNLETAIQPLTTPLNSTLHGGTDARVHDEDGEAAGEEDGE